MQINQQDGKNYGRRTVDKILLGHKFVKRIAKMSRNGGFSCWNN